MAGAVAPPAAPAHDAGHDDHHAEAGHAEQHHGDHHGNGGKECGPGCEGCKHGHHAEPATVVGIDAVLGMGDLEEAGESTKSASFVLGAKHRVEKGVFIGARLPITRGKFTSESETRGVTALGNLEIAPEIVLNAGHHMHVGLELGVALPTASGDAESTDHDKRLLGLMNAGASQARGFEDSALFAAGRAGLIPRVGLEYERGPWEFSAYTKFEFLTLMGGAAAYDPNAHPSAAGAEASEINKTAIESVSGLSLHYGFMHEKVSVGARAWYAAVLKAEKTTAGQDEHPANFVVEPTVRGKLGHFLPAVGYILPLSGELKDRGVGGLRVSLGAAF